MSLEIKKVGTQEVKNSLPGEHFKITPGTVDGVVDKGKELSDKELGLLFKLANSETTLQAEGILRDDLEKQVAFYLFDAEQLRKSQKLSFDSENNMVYQKYIKIAKNENITPKTYDQLVSFIYTDSAQKTVVEKERAQVYAHLDTLQTAEEKEVMVEVTDDLTELADVVKGNNSTETSASSGTATTVGENQKSVSHAESSETSDGEGKTNENVANGENQNRESYETPPKNLITLVDTPENRNKIGEILKKGNIMFYITMASGENRCPACKNSTGMEEFVLNNPDITVYKIDEKGSDRIDKFSSFIDAKVQQHSGDNTNYVAFLPRIRYLDNTTKKTYRHAGQFDKQALVALKNTSSETQVV